MTSASTRHVANDIPLRRDAGLVGLVGLAHMISHFSQLLLPPLFPWLKDEFNASYAELGFLMTIFFIVSCAVQAASGFVVDRFGPRPILFAGLSLLGLSAWGYAASTSYTMLLCCAVVAGIGNGVFHPVDFTLLNRKVSAPRLGHAYSVHGISGSLGWALAPALVLGLTLAFSWRWALLGAGLLAFGVLVLLLLNRARLDLPAAPVPKGMPSKDDSMGFLKIPAVWMCFAFFLIYAIALGTVNAFAPEAARHLHDVPFSLVAICLTVYMVGSASGMVAGGFLAANPQRCERIVAIGFGLAASVALTLALADLNPAAVPVLFGLMGLASGVAGPSRDLLVKRSTPENATGRVYGVVYAGLDIGQAVSPLIFGVLMDKGQFRGVLLGLALVQCLLIVSAFNVRRVRRVPRMPA
jgi:MFS family permease